MPNHALSPDSPEVIEAAAALARHGGNQSRAAAECGVHRATFQNRLRHARKESERLVITPDLSDEEVPPEELLLRSVRAFERQQRAVMARRWYKVMVKEELPYGLMLWGDPHMLSSGWNAPLFLRHIEVAKKPHIYSVNIGDSADNWPFMGRLARLWAETTATSRDEKRLIEWFMFEAGLTWVSWLIGNHDAWNGGIDFHKRLGALGNIPVLDWRAQFVLAHPNETECKVDIAHGRKGSSIYNELHGTVRAAKFGETAHLYVTGHTHNSAIEHLEMADRGGGVVALVQTRGYKHFDPHAVVNGFAEYETGASALAIIDPREGYRRVMAFDDPEEGYEYMTWKRGRAKS